MPRRHSKPARTSHFADPLHGSLQPYQLQKSGGEDRPSTSTKAPGQRLLSYVPHSGWGNQLRALTNALFLASTLNRTLVVPRALKHVDLAGYVICSSSGITEFAALTGKAGAHSEERHDTYAMLATERPPVSNFLDAAKWHSVQSVEHILGRIDNMSVQSVTDQCVNETALVSMFLPRLQSEEASLLQLGSAFTLHAPRVCTCAIAYRKDLVAGIMKLGRSKLGHEFDSLHLRLDEGQHLRFDAEQLVSSALTANVARPLYLASDNVDDAIRVVNVVKQRICTKHGQCRRHILTQHDLNADRAGEVLSYLSLRAQHESEFMRPLLIDAVLALGSNSFFASNKSTFSGHIKAMRNCANFPGLNDCSPSTVSKTQMKLQRSGSLDLLDSTSARGLPS